MFPILILDNSLALARLFLIPSGISMRIEVVYKHSDLDGRAFKTLNSLNTGSALHLNTLMIADVFLTEHIPDLSDELAAELFADPVVQDVYIDSSSLHHILSWDCSIEITYKPGVTDPVAITAREAIERALGQRLEEHAIVQTAQLYILTCPHISQDTIESVKNNLYNPLIQRALCITKKAWEEGSRFPSIYPHAVPPSPTDVKLFDLSIMNEEDLLALSKERLLALSLEEMLAVKTYFSDKAVQVERKRRGIAEAATDVELEMIAQTWSEHCKHKIFQADIEYCEGANHESIHSLFSTYIKNTTKNTACNKPFLKSVFHDNSGVIDFDGEHFVCFKVETHNSPSALDPYGGAITGIVGVNRDIMGTGKGAKPIFNTNVLCFGEPDTPSESIPQGLLHPRQVMRGVHHGIIDGGNQSGIPTVAGAILFDETYIGKPLVFCGTGGIIPARICGEESVIKHIDPGDKAVMIGGRIGKDGIHGATFSSLVLDDVSPTSAVQIGDPITQKKMLDFLLEARDMGLYKGITDNGAGGLSSSLGEMAEASGGIRIYLHLCPVKYQGLAPWEIFLSESQERMSLSVADANIGEFLALAKKRNVEATVVGEFTDSGFIEVFHGSDMVVCLSLNFLHRGLPVMKLKAEWIPQCYTAEVPEETMDLKDALLKLLADPTIASKESFVRQYDHEVQAQSIIKPFVGVKSNAPSDGAVLRPLASSQKGITVTHGICPRYGDTDTYHMAMCAVDEAYRAHIALGGDPEFVAALDNFCWPDPVQSENTPDGTYKLAQLVRACKGLHDACTSYGIPLISGKDSMKNDARIGGRKVSVRPTLLVSCMGLIEDCRKAMSTDFKHPGDGIYIIGETRRELVGSSFEKVFGRASGSCPRVQTEQAKRVYTALHAAIHMGYVASCHDLSDGGLGIATCECCLGGMLGADIDLGKVATSEPLSPVELLFSETPSRFIVSIRKEHQQIFESACADLPVRHIGTVQKAKSLEFFHNGHSLCRVSLGAIEKAFLSFGG